MPPAVPMPPGVAAETRQGPEAPAARDGTVRDARIGDLAWTAHRQAVLYHEEFGYSVAFESYVAQSIGPFAAGYDAARDHLWIAERAGAPVGAIAIQHDAARPGFAKLRWYFLEPSARGLGLGKRLLNTALAFARQAGYSHVYLHTVDDLHEARRQYEKAGFTLSHTETEACEWAPWGHEQEWVLDLRK